MYYYPVSAVLTECLILSVVEQQDLRKEWREYRDTIDDIVEGRLRK